MIFWCVTAVGGCAKARKYGGKNATSTPWRAAPDPALPWAAAKGKAQNHPSAAAMHNFKKSQVRAARKARFPAANHNLLREDTWGLASTPNPLNAHRRRRKGWVHRGFRTEAQNILEEVFVWVEAHPNKTIIITCHSLGAATATYITQEIEFRFDNIDRMKLFTFGSPRLGNDEYLRCFETSHWRFVNNNDLVTHVPPQISHYRHHRQLCYINFYGNIRPLSTWQIFKDTCRGHLHACNYFDLFDGIREHLIDGYVSKLKNIENTDQKIGEKQ
jgi:hypothetical protein